MGLSSCPILRSCDRRALIGLCVEIGIFGMGCYLTFLVFYSMLFNYSALAIISSISCSVNAFLRSVCCILLSSNFKGWLLSKVILDATSAGSSYFFLQHLLLILTIINHILLLPTYITIVKLTTIISEIIPIAEYPPIYFISGPSVYSEKQTRCKVTT